MYLFAAVGDDHFRSHQSIGRIFPSHLVLQNADRGITSQIIQTGVVSESNAKLSSGWVCRLPI
jgi:hypothetical protein